MWHFQSFVDHFKILFDFLLQHPVKCTKILDMYERKGKILEKNEDQIGFQSERRLAS